MPTQATYLLMFVPTLVLTIFIVSYSMYVSVSLYFLLKSFEKPSIELGATFSNYSIRLDWTPVTGAMCYLVFRKGKKFWQMQERVFKPFWVDPAPGEDPSTYVVLAITSGWIGLQVSNKVCA